MRPANSRVKLMKRAAILGMMLLAYAQIGFAEMYVDKSIVTFEPGQPPRQDVRVSNSGSDVMYVQVETFVVKDPGTASEERVLVTNPQEGKLVASPNKLVIPPGGHKLVRILNLDPKSAEERIYRINVTPIAPPLEEQTSQLRIVVAYQVLTIVQPAEPHTKLEVSRTGKQVTFTNQGNTNILLSDGRQCSQADPTACKTLDSHRIYAGSSWALELPYDAPLSYSVRSFDGIKNEVFP